MPVETLIRHCQPETKSEAFPMRNNLERIPPEARAAHANSYLGEYRLQVSRYGYNLAVINGKICDPFNNDNFMTDATGRAINEKILQGKSPMRERAELKAFNYLEEQLSKMQDGDSVVWFSPPGPKEEYGDYGFVFFGKLNSTNSQLEMTALRVEKPTLEQFNQAFNLIAKEPGGYSQAEEFLENPRVIAGLTQESLEKILGNVFSFKVDERREKNKHEILERMGPVISDFALLLGSGSTEEKLKAFHALENYALDLKAEYEGRLMVKMDVRRLEGIIGDYGYEPPKVVGSCGASSNEFNKTSNIFNSLSSLDGVIFEEEDEYGSRKFECPDCGHINIRPKNELITHCQNPNCKSTKVAC